MARRKTKMRTVKVKRVKKTRKSRRTKRNTRRRRNKRGGDFSKKMRQQGNNLLSNLSRGYSHATDKITTDKGYNLSSMKHYARKLKYELMQGQPDEGKLRHLLGEYIKYGDLFKDDIATNNAHLPEHVINERQTKFTDHRMKSEKAELDKDQLDIDNLKNLFIEKTF